MMSWGEFKKKVESQGVKDEMIMEYIDVDGFNEPNVELKQVTNLNGGGFTFRVWS